MEKEALRAIKLLKDEFSQRQRKNPSYSLRSFAQQLGFSAGTVSSLLNSKRTLTPKTAQKLVERLSLSPLKKEIFKTSVKNDYYSRLGLTPEEYSTTVLDEEAHYRIIAEWEHYAILTLMELKSFRSNPSWIGEKLGIPTARVEQTLERLLAEKLIKKDKKGNYARTFEKLSTSEDISSQALKEAHHEELQLAREKLYAVSVEDRDFSSVTLALSKKRLQEAKEKIRLFRKEMMALLKDDDADEVYQLQIQFYPFTQMSKGEKR